MSEQTAEAGNTTKTTENHDATRRAGRGGIAIFGAKVYFILTGFLQQPILPIVIGLPAYGALSRVLAIANVFNNVVVSACTQGMSRAVAQRPGEERAVLRQLMPAHAAVAIVLAFILAALAPVFARFESAEYIKTPLYVMAGLLFVYGVYAPLVGYFNGRGSFGRQAALDITAATLRTFLLVGAGAFFVARHMSGALGATVGAAIAALFVCALAITWVTARSQAEVVPPVASPGPAISTSTYFARLLPIALAQFFTNVLMQSDLTLVGRFLSLSAHVACNGADDSALASCMAAADKSADEWVAVYRACQLFAFLPFQLLFSVTQVLFPMLAKVSSDKKEVARLASRGARLGLILCGLPLAAVVAMPASFISFAYGKDVAMHGARSLHILAIGQLAFAMMSLGTTILVSLGKEIQAMALTLAAVALVVVSCFVTVPAHAFGEDQLIATAMATSIALGIAMLFAFALVVRAAGAFIPISTIARVGFAIACAWFAGNYLPRVGKLMTPLLAAVICAVYIVLLLLTRELGATDIAWAKSVLGRKKA